MPIVHRKDDGWYVFVHGGVNPNTRKYDSAIAVGPFTREPVQKFSVAFTSGDEHDEWVVFDAGTQFCVYRSKKRYMPEVCSSIYSEYEYICSLENLKKELSKLLGLSRNGKGATKK